MLLSNELGMCLLGNIYVLDMWYTQRTIFTMRRFLRIFVEYNKLTSFYPNDLERFFVAIHSAPNKKYELLLL